MKIPRTYVLSRFREDPNVLGVGVGKKVVNGEVVTDCQSLTFLVKKKLARRRLASKTCDSSCLPRTVHPRSRACWGDGAGRDLVTDVLEVGALSGFSGRFNPGDLLGFLGGSGYATISGVVELTAPGGNREVLFLGSGHAASSPNSKRALLIDLATGDRAGAVLRYLSAPGPRTVVDAALVALEPGAGAFVDPVADHGPRFVGVARVHGRDVRLDGIVRSQEIRPGRTFDATSRGREVAEIPVLVVGATVRDVSLKGGWPIASYVDQIITPQFLFPGESGSLLHSGGAVAGMLNGGTTRLSNIGFPANFWSPIESVMRRILGVAGASAVSFLP